MKLLILADPAEKIKPQGDSTLVLAKEGLKRGHQMLWATDSDLEYVVDEVAIHGREIKQCESNQVPVLGKRERYRLQDLDGVLIRKDPPFDTGYVRL